MHARVYSCRVCDLEILIEGSAGHINLMRLCMVLNLHCFFSMFDNMKNQYHVDQMRMTIYVVIIMTSMDDIIKSILIRCNIFLFTLIYAYSYEYDHK